MMIARKQICLRFLGVQMTRAKWRVIELHRVFGEGVPSKPGVYAIARAQRVLGIPLATTPLYVGKSKNLGGVFVQHADPLREHNRTLNDAAIITPLEFWFVVLPEDQLNSTERKAVRLLQPLTNIIRYRSENEHDSE